MTIGPSIGHVHGPMRIEPPSFGEDLSDEGAMSGDEASDKPLGIEEFRQRIENTKVDSTSKGKKKSKVGRK